MNDSFLRLLGMQGRLFQARGTVEGTLRRLFGGMQGEAQRLAQDPRLGLYFDSVQAGSGCVEATFGTTKLSAFLARLPELSGFESVQVSFESIHSGDGEPAPDHLEDALRSHPELGLYLIGGKVENGGRELVLYFTQGAQTDARHLLDPVELKLHG